MTRSRRRTVAVAAMAAVGLPLIAFAALHTTSGRRLLGFEACPFGGRAAPAQIDALRAAALAPLRGESAAPARPAFGFELDHTRRADIEAWATAACLSCSEEASGTALRCERTTSGPVRDLYARLDAADRLVAVDVMSTTMDAAAAAERFQAVQSTLRRDLGTPATTSGEASPGYLAERPFRRAAVQFRFADYAADVSATNLARDGVIVREQYRSIPARANGG